MTSLHPYRYEIKHISYPTRMFTPAPTHRAALLRRHALYLGLDAR